MNKTKRRTPSMRRDLESLESRRFLASDVSFEVNPIESSLGQFGQVSFIADLNGDQVNEVVAFGNQWYQHDADSFRLEYGGSLPTVNRDFLTFYSPFAVADLDADGDVDLVSRRTILDGGGGSVSSFVWHENDDGKFESKRDLVVEGNFHIDSFLHLAILDVDGDGDLDVHFGRDDNVSFCGQEWAENDGHGNFENRRYPNEPRCEGQLPLADPGHDGFAEVPEVIHPNSPTVDIDLDGDLDLVSTAQLWSLSWHENRDGELIEHKIGFEFTFQQRNVYPTDIDSDGDIDLILHHSSEVGWFENIDGSGNFSEFRPIGVDLTSGLVVGDHNNDGITDYISAVPGSGKIISHRFDSETGMFVRQQDIELPQGDEIQDVADLDSDGDLDVVGRNFWYKQLGANGNFERIDYEFTSTPDAVRAGDINDDSDIDFIAVTQDGIDLYDSVLSGDDDSQRIGEGIEDFEILELVDLDVDNDLDLVWSTRAGTLSWLMNEGDKGFSNALPLFSTSNSESIHSLKDIDGDGDLDLILNGETGTDWIENTENTFDSRHSIADVVADAFILGDVDGDGDDDFAVANEDNDIDLYRNVDGQGNFDNGTPVISGEDFPEISHDVKVAGLELSDLNADGDLDLSVNLEYRDHFRLIFANSIAIVAYDNLDGLGSFQSSGTIVAADELLANDLRAVDINGDGYDDFVSSDWTVPGIYVFENLADGADVNRDGQSNAADIDRLCLAIANNETDESFDLNDDGAVDALDVETLVFDKLNSTFGDVDLDGDFDRDDLVSIFERGHYQDNKPQNSSWIHGDWNCDGEFDSSDLVVAFTKGDYSDIPGD